MTIIVDGIEIRPEDCRPTAETLAKIAPILAETAASIAAEDPSTFRRLDDFKADVRRRMEEVR